MIFHLPQFEHEPFWQYLSRLNYYRTQYVHFVYEKWKTCNVACERITHETRATLASMFYGGLCCLNVDKVWDLFECLSSYQSQYECASEYFVCPSSPPYDLHSQSLFVDQFRDRCNHHSSYLVDVCFHYQSFDHDVNPCPYYDVFDEAHGGLNAMIETMNE